MNRKILLGLFFLLILGYAFAGEVNIVEITSPSEGTYWKDGEHNIIFKVYAEDVNGTEGKADLNIEVYYSAVAGSKENLIADFNLINTSYCGNVNDFNNVSGIECTIPWAMDIVADGNYFIDLKVYTHREKIATGDSHEKSSDSFYADNSGPQIFVIYPTGSNTDTQQVSFDVNDLML